MLEFGDAGFEFFHLVEARLEVVESFDDASEAFIFLLTADAGLHPDVEGPKRKDENPEFHGASGPGSDGHVADKKSVQGANGS